MTEVSWVVRHMRHSGGTKFYELVYISVRGKSDAVTIRRWGKVGLAGSTKVSRDDTGHEFRFTQELKQKRGYSVLDDKNGSGTLREFVKAYSNYASDVGTIRLALGITVDDESSSPVATPEPPKPKIDRSSDPLWGSW